MVYSLFVLVTLQADKKEFYHRMSLLFIGLRFRNRVSLTVICCPIYHWLSVSREVDISQSASDILFIDDWPTTSDILGNISLVGGQA